MESDTFSFAGLMKWARSFIDTPKAADTVKNQEETPGRSEPQAPSKSKANAFSSVAPSAFSESLMTQIDQMDGRAFERFLKTLFEKQGYQVEMTAYYDWGGDLVLEKNQTRTLVQAKRWKHRVKMSAVQEVVAAKAKYKAQHAMVVTNSHFTYQAQELADANQVVLWNRAVLAEQLRLFPTASPQTNEISATKHTAPAEPATLSCCALCGRPVTESVAAYCRTNAPRFNSKIYCFPHQKRAPRRIKAAAASVAEAA